MLIKIVTIISLLILLIRFKVTLALAIVIDAITVGILFGLDWLQLLKAFPVTLSQPTTLEFLLIIYLVILLGELMRTTGNLMQMVHSLEKILKDYRIGVGIPSALIGLLPMPAGAMLSAPIVKEIGTKTNITSEKMTYINFWFRHVWEFFWPLFPGIILTTGIFNVPIRNIMISNFPLSLSAIVVGLFFTMRLPKVEKSRVALELNHIWGLLYNMWPIIFVIVLVLIVQLRMSIALAASVLGMIFCTEIKIKDLSSIFKKAFSISTLGVIYAVFLFKYILQISGALNLIPQITAGTNFSVLSIIFLAPFIVGFLTGINSAFVGITFPVLVPFINTGDVNMQYLMFAYASGFSGVLLSPVHLCLALTKEYYGAEFSKVYKYLIPSVIFILLVALIILFISIF